MPPKLPRGFAPKKKDAEVAEPLIVRARPPVSEEAIKIGTQPEHGKQDERKDASKRHAETSLDVNAAKRRKAEGAPGQVGNLFGPISAAYVGESDVQKWQSLPSKDQDASMIRAAAQLLTQTIGRAQRCQEERLALEKEKANNKKLAEMVVENDNKWKKTLDEKNASYEAMKARMEEAVQHRDLLNTENEQLRKDKEEMQLRIDSLELEKTKASSEKTRQDIHDAGFQAGFDYYCVGFLAQDPEYDWSKWGKETVEDMALFKVERAEDIRKRRVELGLEDEGASSVMQILQNEAEIPHDIRTTPVLQNKPVDRQVEEVPATNAEDASSVPQDTS